MTTLLISEDPAVHSPFRRTGRMLVDLHRVMRSGEGDSQAADQIREELDPSWKELDAREMGLLRGLSADLRTIGASREQASLDACSPSSDEFAAALAVNDWDFALRLLREHESRLSPRSVSFCRGACWSHLGVPEAAIEFLHEADRLGPLEDEEQPWLLIGYLLSNEMAPAIRLAYDAVASSTSPTLLLVAGEILSIHAAEGSLPTSDSIHQLAIDALNRSLGSASNNGASRLPEILQPAAWLHLALNYDALGDRSEARTACQQALRLEPKNEYALLLLGWLSFDETPQADRPAFRQSVSRSIAMHYFPVASAA